MSEFACPRRALMVGAGVSMLLAACGKDGQGQPAVQGPAGAGDELIKTGDVAVGNGVVTPSGVLVLQLTQGSFTAYSAICPHQTWRVSPPDAQGVITCTAHLSHFRAEDGSKVDGPAPSGLTPIPVQVRDGLVVRTT